MDTPALEALVFNSSFMEPMQDNQCWTAKMSSPNLKILCKKTAM